MHRLIHEPLVHFVGLAALIFLAHQIVSSEGPGTPDEIRVSAARIEQLSGLFQKTWQRPPSKAELKGLVDSYIKEEVYYREAVAMGLDKDDTVIRRRMRQKMEFLSLAVSELREPTDNELRTFLEANADNYAIEPQVAFFQVFFDPQRRGLSLDDDLQVALQTLESSDTQPPHALGDATLLPEAVQLSRVSLVSRNFGNDFTEAIADLPPGEWSGPVISSFGVHLVRVVERVPGREAKLEDVREAVLRDWQSENRKAFEDQQFEKILKNYNVVVDTPGLKQLKTAGAQ